MIDLVRRPLSAASAIVAGAFAIGVATAPAFAGSFAVKENSASAQGASFAGSTAGANDVTYIFKNPAALRSVEGFEIGGNLSYIAPSAEGDTSLLNQSVDPGVDAVVPAFHLGYRINEQFIVGVSVVSPFGLVTEYEDDFVGAADGLQSELLTIVATPVLAVEVTDSFTIAAGVSVMYAAADLTSGVFAGQVDGFEVGFTAGALLDVTDSTTLGATFRSSFDLKLEGDAQDNVGVFTGAPGTLFSATAEAELPGLFALGLSQGLTDDVRLLAEFQIQFWSSFDEFSITNDANGATLAEVQNYDDALFIAVGLEGDVTEELTLRSGVAFDETPTIDADRSVRVPDADRLWLSLGASYDLTEHMTVDLAYSYIFGLDDPVVVLKNGGAAGSTVTYDAEVHIISIGGSMKF